MYNCVEYMTIIFLKIATHLMIYLLQHPTFCPPKPLMFFLKKNLFKSTKVEPFLTISGNYSFSYTKDKEGDCSTFPWEPNCKCLWWKSWVLSIGCLSKWQLFHHCFVVILEMAPDNATIVPKYYPPDPLEVILSKK